MQNEKNEQVYVSFFTTEELQNVLKNTEKHKRKNEQAKEH